MAQERLRALGELLRRPGNARCADCGAPDPDWASYTLGVFICLSCSAIHRNIPQVSKVKSVRLDAWEEAQVEFMASHGNAAAQATYEPHVPPFYYRPAPADCHLLREQWIRAKYERQEFTDPEKQEPYSAGYREGFLWKRGRDNGQFLSRKFVLTEREGALKYFNRNDGRARPGVLGSGSPWASEGHTLGADLGPPATWGCEGPPGPAAGRPPVDGPRPEHHPRGRWGDRWAQGEGAARAQVTCGRPCPPYGAPSLWLQARSPGQRDPRPTPPERADPLPAALSRPLPGQGAQGRHEDRAPQRHLPAGQDRTPARPAGHLPEGQQHPQHLRLPRGRQGDGRLVQRAAGRPLPLPAGGLPGRQRRRPGAEADQELPEGGLHGEDRAQDGGLPPALVHHGRPEAHVLQGPAGRLRPGGGLHRQQGVRLHGAGRAPAIHPGPPLAPRHHHRHARAPVPAGLRDRAGAAGVGGGLPEGGGQAHAAPGVRRGSSLQTQALERWPVDPGSGLQPRTARPQAQAPARGLSGLRGALSPHHWDLFLKNLIVGQPV